MAEDSIFTRIMNGEIPSDIVYEDEDCICIKDIAPKAPVHVLLIPRKPIPRLVDATAEDQALMGRLMVTAGEIARQLGIDEAFRLVINNGPMWAKPCFTCICTFWVDACSARASWACNPQPRIGRPQRKSSQPKCPGNSVFWLSSYILTRLLTAVTLRAFDSRHEKCRHSRRLPSLF